MKDTTKVLMSKKLTQFATWQIATIPYVRWETIRKNMNFLGIGSALGRMYYIFHSETLDLDNRKIYVC